MNKDALDLLAGWRAVGLTLTREGDSLRVRPLSRLTKTRLQAILNQKRELLAALEAERIASEIIKRAACRKRVVR